MIDQPTVTVTKPTQKSSFLKYILEGVLFLLLLFIPLYPKLPLLDVGFTWTYIRVEDFLAALSFGVLSLFLIFRRARIKNFLLWPIVVFWIVGLVSSVWAVLTVGVPDNWAVFKQHLIVLHYLRRIEYLGVFFVAFTAMGSLRSVKRVVVVLIIGLAGVVLYGLGQRYLGFCSYLTMNEEFAKGVCIPLQDSARISSTFGGHYDLAGYLVLLLPIVVSMIFVVRRLYFKIGLGALALLGFFILVLTSSRISFFAFFVSMGVLLFMSMRHKKFLYIGLAVVVALTVLFGRTTIIDRFSKTLRIKQVTVNPANGRVMETPTRQKDWGGLPESDTVLLLPFLPVEATGSAYEVTKYEKGSEEDMNRATMSGMMRNSVEVPQAEIEEGTVNDKREIIEEVKVVQGNFEMHYALVFDISLTTRLHGEWPKTLAAFYKHPVLGQGYSTVTAAVDSSYVRALGEVGVLGFVSFFAILVIFLWRAVTFVSKTSTVFPKMYVAGVAAGVVGLLVNATLIDIFEASKVAFMLWMVLGIAVWVIENRDTNSV